MNKLISYLILLITLTSCGQEGEDTIRLVPTGYEGPVLILFNQENGIPKEYEGDKRVYRIPKNGVLRTQFSQNYGTQNHQFFYVNEDGERQEIPFMIIQNKGDSKEINNSKKVFAYFEKALGEGFGIGHNNKEYKIEPARTFYLGKLEDIDKEYKEQLNFIFKYHK